MLLSCKKDIELQKKLNTSSTTAGAFSYAGRQSTVSSAYVLEWLENQKNSSTPFKNNFIQNVLDKMEIDNMYVEIFDEEENFIIIPIQNEYFSQNINSNGPFPIQYLLLVEDANGNIRRGDVALFYPEDPNITKLPENSFRDFFNSTKIYVNGTFTLLTLGDIKQYEIDFEDGGFMAEHRSWERESSAQANCQDWWLVTITYYSDGTYEIDNEYLGNFCSSCPPNQLCDVLEGGGGASIDDPEQIAKIKTLVIRDVQPTSGLNAWWSASADFNLMGYRYSDASNNYFTSVTTFGLIHFGNTGVYGWYLHSGHAEWVSVSHTAGIGLIDKLAHGEASGTVAYPNDPGSSQPSLVLNSVNWNAASALY